MNFFTKLIKGALKKVGLCTVLPKKCEEAIDECLINFKNKVEHFMTKSREKTLEQIIYLNGEKIRKIWEKVLAKKNKSQKITYKILETSFIKRAKKIKKLIEKFPNLIPIEDKLETKIFCAYLSKSIMKLKKKHVTNILNGKDANGEEVECSSGLSSFVCSNNDINIRLTEARDNGFIFLLSILCALKKAEIIEKKDLINNLKFSVDYLANKDKTGSNESKKLPDFLDYLNKFFSEEFLVLKKYAKKYEIKSIEKSSEEIEIVKTFEMLKNIIIKFKDILDEFEEKTLNGIKKVMYEVPDKIININNEIINKLNSIDIKSPVDEETLKNIFLNQYNKINKEEYEKSYINKGYINVFDNFESKLTETLSKKSETENNIIELLKVLINGCNKALETVKIDKFNYYISNAFISAFLEDNNINAELIALTKELKNFDVYFNNSKEDCLKFYIIRNKLFDWTKKNSASILSDQIHYKEINEKISYKNDTKSKVQIVQVLFGLNLRDEKNRKIFYSHSLTARKFRHENADFELKNCKNFGVSFIVQFNL
ncbi:MAG: hypothetical protein FWC41_03860 [Firmicutes bacterium]|nr:hypothetical protein [Bacillota bacterium]